MAGDEDTDGCRTFWRGTGTGKLRAMAERGRVGIEPASLPSPEEPSAVRPRGGTVRELWIADQFERAYGAAADADGLVLELEIPNEEVNEETAYPSGYETDLVPSLGPEYDAYEEQVLSREWPPDYTVQSIPGGWVEGVYEVDPSQDPARVTVDDLNEVRGWERL